MEKKSRVYRVGVITAGLSMISFGVMFILHLFGGLMSYQTIFKLWPFMVISLGIELLVSFIIDKKYVYDKGAVVLMVITAFLAAGMAGIGFIIEMAGIMTNLPV